MGAYTYEDVTSPWLSEIPQHWKLDRIKDFVSFNPSIKAADLVPKELVSLIPMECVSDQGDITSQAQVAYQDVDRGLNYFENGDVIFAKITPCMENGKGALVENIPTRVAFGSTEFFVLRPTFKADGKYIFYLTWNPLFRVFLTANMKGAAGQQRVPAKFLQLCEVPLPPVEEQRAIVKFLDAACAKLDMVIEAKREQLSQFEGIEKSIINQANLTGINPKAPKKKIDSVWFNELPAHWEVKRLKDVSDMQTGITLGKDFTEETEERPYMRVANVQDGYLSVENMKTISMPPRLIPRYELRDGDVLMTEGGDLDKLGRGQVWRSQVAGCLHQNHVFALRCYPHKLLPDYLALLTSSTHGRAYFEIMGKKTTNLASINSTKVNLFPVPLPPIDEQKKIVEWVQKKRDKIQQARSAVSAQITILEMYRKSLIHECVTGKKQVYHGAIN